VFDLGEVLVPSAVVLPPLAAVLGVAQAELAAAYWPPRQAYDLGGDAGTYWTAVLVALGRQPDPQLVDQLCRQDADKWSTLPQQSLDLLAALDGTRLGVLSNAPTPLASSVRAASWSAAVDVLVFSADLGLAKPDPRIYARADAAYGTDPHEVVFFDDRAENVAAARRHGWEAHLWVDPATALEAIEARR
jgi:putative hydrolase of the HAD superfamily